MAALRSLVSAVAPVDGRGQPHVYHRYRTLADAGVLPRGKRGRGGPIATFRRAADFLIGLNGSEEPRDAPQAVKEFRSLRPVVRHAQSDAEPWSAIDKAETFGDALEALIERAPAVLGSFFALAEELFPDEPLSLQAFSATDPSTIQLAIEFSWFPVVAEIRIEQFPSMPEYHRVFRHWSYLLDVELWKSGFYRMGGDGDRRTTMRVGLRTILALNAAVRGDEVMDETLIEARAEPP